MSPVRAPEAVRAKPDATCVAAVGPAREAALVEAGGSQVGDHLGHLVEGERLVTHYFASTHPGYRGWRWAVTVTRASRARAVTVDEVVMLPGDDAVVAPAWVPWAERVQPGDLRPGDLFPTAPDDPRLEPGFTETGAPDDVLAVVEELGLGRERVLSPIGRDDAADRWIEGDFGPSSAIAQAVPYRCHTCGYWLRLADSLGRAFGACANAMAPGEGRVVASDFGCGAHSDVVVESQDHPPTEHAFDTTGYDELTMPPSTGTPAPTPEPSDSPTGDPAPAPGDTEPGTDEVTTDEVTTGQATTHEATLDQAPVAEPAAVQPSAVEPSAVEPSTDEPSTDESAAVPRSGDEPTVTGEIVAEADAVQAEVEAAAEPPSDDEVLQPSEPQPSDALPEASQSSADVFPADSEPTAVTPETTEPPSATS